VAPEKAMAR